MSQPFSNGDSRPGVSAEEAVLIASDLLHEDYAYMFEAFWDLVGAGRKWRVDVCSRLR